ncbi:MAG: SRPBCC family protein [Solirubrobacteraceae bacterium]|nr:SRPBCC family protein [Solirubrobacteraceae bacterium]
MSRASWVHVEHDFSAPVGDVFAYLGEHENLETVFPGTKIKRLTSGDGGDRNGVGSSRELRIGPLLPFTETVTETVPDELIVYEISGGVTPLRGHRGIMRFTPTPGGGTHLDYKIRVSSAIPGIVPVVKAGLTKALSDGLPAADRLISA